MRTSTLRLHSVRMKAGGAEVRVFDSGSISRDMARRLERRAGEQGARRNLAGFVLVTWGTDGGTSTSIRVAHGSITRPHIQSLVEECVRDYLIGTAAEDTIMDRLGFRPPDGA